MSHPTFPSPQLPFNYNTATSSAHNPTISNHTANTVGGTTTNMSKRLATSRHYRKTTVLYKDMLSKSKAFRDAIQLAAQHASEYSDAILEWSRHIPSVSQEEALGVQKYAELLSIFSNGYSNISEWVSTSFTPPLEANLQYHAIIMKSTTEKYKLTHQLVTKHVRQMDKKPAPDLEAYRNNLGLLSETTGQLQLLQNQYLSSMQAEEKRSIKFVNQKAVELMMLETHLLWNPIIEHVRESFDQFNTLQLLSKFNPQPVPEVQEETRSSLSELSEKNSFFSCASQPPPKDALA